MSVAIALFTRDLRVHDNPVLAAAARTADQVVPLFVVDKALVPPRCPPNRAHFLAAALSELDGERQWVAGTGTHTHTRPNRVLNPLRQADRYAPDGTYVRRWLPEPAHLPGARIHRPWRENVDPATYPVPIIDAVGR
ncbi:FAD-binding domain-containing protein [Nocardia rhizosphaerihabitans]|uniref:Photolyase/cryptochrome alpha/beta domain-containing protein n=1 Tax=Nocardia rhizosphaerihabitans TaxID=1691570 RepID=A0ABQ2KKP5_9NOCA|nr:FAD-binding domain-containing protein [Nocardia rhizosphaerihabitans]GGN82614.1 hypothetical protein GCM10011610_34160 [Nocardia rhizosphaerihabitans]